MHPRHSAVTNMLGPPSAKYSQARIIHFPDRREIYTSATLGINPRENILVSGVQEQTQQALGNIMSLVRSQGGGIDDLVKVGMYVDDPEEHKDACDAAYIAFFRAQQAQQLPVRSVAQSGKLSIGHTPIHVLFDAYAVVFKPSPEEP